MTQRSEPPYVAHLGHLPRENRVDIEARGSVGTHALADQRGKGVAMAWLLTLAILIGLAHFELWPLVGLWACYMVATSLTTPKA